jgi:hypothetical protein
LAHGRQLFSEEPCAHLLISRQIRTGECKKLFGGRGKTARTRSHFDPRQLMAATALECVQDAEFLRLANPILELSGGK